MFRYFWSAFLSEGLLTFLRCSLLSGLVVTLMTSSSTWQYLENSLSAYDLLRSSAWVRSVDATKQPAIVMIDDTGYEKFFNAQSPLSRARMLELFKTVVDNTPKTSRILVDIDLSPAAGQEKEQAELDDFLRQHPGRWVLPAVKSWNPQTAEKIKQWKLGLCAQGVGFGLPYVPIEFGYPKMTHQFQDGLADATTQAKLPCADPDMEYVQKPMPLSNVTLKSGLILPFSGDLVALGKMLQATSPPVVVLGGAWGQTDVLGSPFGDRFGVQIHAAAVAGSLNNLSLAPVALELLVVWIFVSLISTLLGSLSKWVDRQDETQTDSMSGHEFFRERGKPFVFIVLTFGLLMGLAEVLAFIHVHTGVWMSSSKVGAITLGTMLLTWDWGRTMPVQFDGLKHTWREVVSKPIGRDCKSLIQSCKILLGGNPNWVEQGRSVAVSKKKVITEAGLVLMSLLSQTALPLYSLYQALTVPL